jgi:hypothetical protein
VSSGSGTRASGRQSLAAFVKFSVFVSTEGTRWPRLFLQGVPDEHHYSRVILACLGKMLRYAHEIELIESCRGWSCSKSRRNGSISSPSKSFPGSSTG